jgi:hypothetical protein
MLARPELWELLDDSTLIGIHIMVDGDVLWRPDRNLSDNKPTTPCGVRIALVVANILKG